MMKILSVLKSNTIVYFFLLLSICPAIAKDIVNESKAIPTENKHLKIENEPQDYNSKVKGHDNRLKSPQKKISQVTKSPFILNSGKLGDDQIYSSNKIPESVINTSKNVNIINSKNIDIFHPLSIEEILGTVSGVQLARKGSIGSRSMFNIMGMNRNLITLDGIRFHNSSLNIPLLNPLIIDGVERIEVIKGPSASLHGTDSNAGILALYTKTGQGRPKMELGAGMGNNSTFKENFSFGGGNDSYDYYLGVIRLDTSGGAPTYFNESKNDDYGNFTVISNLGKVLLDGKAEVRNIFSYSTAEKENGVQLNGFPIFDPDDQNFTTLIYNNSSFAHAPTKWYDYCFKFATLKSKFKDYDNDVVREFDFIKTDNQRLIFLTQHNIRYKDINTLSVGYDLEYNHFKGLDVFWNNTEKNIIKNDIFFNDVINIKDTLFIKGGTRITNFSLFGTYATPNISATIKIPTPKLKDSYSKASFSYGYSLYEPSPYQLFGRYGNPELIPEQVFGYNLGFEQHFFKDKARIKCNLFHNKIEELISIDPNLKVLTLQNIPHAKTEGVETSLYINPYKGVKLMGSYTYVNARQFNPITLNDDPIETVPSNSWNFIASYVPKEDYGVYFNGTTSSTRYGIDYRTFEPGRTKGYVDLGLGAVCKLFEIKGFKVVWFGQLKNLMNKKYEQVLGYQHDGFRFLTGIKIKKSF